MGYLFCLLALLAGVTKGYCGKKTSGMITGLPATMLFNAARMLTCIPIGLLFVLGYTHGLTALAIDPVTLLIAAVSGLCTSAFVVTWIMAVRTGAYMMVDVFLTLGVAVPVVGCRLFFGEAIRRNQVVGILLLGMAAYIMCTYHHAIGKSRLTLRALALLAACGGANGLSSFSQKWFRYAGNADVSVFNFYTYVFAAAVLLVCWLAARHGRTEATAPSGGGKPVARLAGYIVVMSLCIFLHSLFSTTAAAYLTSSQLYPLMQGGGLVLSMGMAALLFGERITPRCLLGIGADFLALLVINLL